VLRTQQDQWSEARNTLESERAANARITAGLAASRAESERLSSMIDHQRDEAMEMERMLRAELAASQAECERMRGALSDLGVTADEARAGVERSRANKRDAERYRWLRNQLWETASLCVVENPKRALRLGSYCPRGEYLDAAIDAALAGEVKP